MVPLMAPARGSFPESTPLREVQIPGESPTIPTASRGCLPVPLPDTNVPGAGGRCSCPGFEVHQIGLAGR